MFIILSVVHTCWHWLKEKLCYEINILPNCKTRLESFIRDFRWRYHTSISRFLLRLCRYPLLEEKPHVEEPQASSWLRWFCIYVVYILCLDLMSVHTKFSWLLLCYMCNATNELLTLLTGNKSFMSLDVF
jgi:hypothetical protein